MRQFIILPLGLVVGLAIGFAAGRGMRPKRDPVAADAGVTPPKGPPAPVAAKQPKDESSALTIPADTAARRTLARGGPAVEAMLADFDRRKPMESRLRILQRVMASSPQELGDMVRGMSGKWLGDPGWADAKQAALQRWVEVAPDEAMAWARTATRQGVDIHEAAGVYGMLAMIDPSRALARARGLEPGMFQQQAMQAVLGTMAQSDPNQAMKLSEGLPAQVRNGVLHAVFDAWAGRDPRAAAAGIMELKDPMARWGGMHSVMRHFSEQDPDGALQWAKSLPEAGMRQQVLNQLFQQLGQRDPDKALVLAESLPKHQQLQVQKEFVGAWIRRDPEAAEAWILSRSNTIEQQQLVMATVGPLSWMDPARASTLVTKLAPGSARDNALRDLIGMWNWSDSTAAQSFAQTLPEADQLKLRGPLAEGLAWRDPEKAIAYLKDNPLDDPAHHTYSNLARALAERTTPAKALEWAMSLEDEASRQRALPEVFSRMAAQEPAEAAKAVLGLPEGASREESLSRVGGAWAENDFEDALSWARGLNGKDRESALGAVLTQGAPHQPGLAATQYAEMLGGLPASEKPADSFVNAAATIAGAYFAEDQTKAASWVSGLPQEDARAAAARTLAEQWSQYDAPSASEWIGSLPDGKPRDQAVGALVNRIAASDPSMAFEWAATVDDSSLRSSSLEAAFQSWRKLDPSAARAAVETANWPDDEKARWIEKLR